MSSVGAYLRELRQRQGVSLEEIARTTRVARRYLEALEADAFDALPSPVFTRGFIRAYCQAVSQSPEEALAAYDSRGGDTSTAPPVAGRSGAMAVGSATRVSRSTGAPTSRRAADNEARGRGAVLVSFVLLVVLGVALFAVALVIHPRDRAERVAVTSRPEPRAESRPGRAPDDATPAASASGLPPSAGAPTTQPSARPAPPTASGSSATPTTAMPRIPAATAPTPTPTAPPPAIAATAPTSTATPPAPAPSGAAASPAPRPAPASPSAPASGAPATPGLVATAPSASASPNLDAVVGSVASPYRLVARTNETTWIRVRTDDGRTSEENVPAGEVREWISNRPFVLTIGNAGGVSLELNGRALPPLGPKGLVIQRILLPPEPR